MTCQVLSQINHVVAAPLGLHGRSNPDVVIYFMVQTLGPLVRFWHDTANQTDGVWAQVSLKSVQWFGATGRGNMTCSMILAIVQQIHNKSNQSSSSH